MFITKIKLYKTVELIKKNIRQKLASEIANDDAATFGLIEQTFAGRKLFPVGAFATNSDVTHRFIKNDFVPEIFECVIQTLAVIGVAANAVLFVGTRTMVKLLL